MTTLYIYSPDHVAFVRAKWAWPVFAAGVLLLTTMLSAGGLALLRFSNNGTTSRSANALIVENDILRYQTRLINTRVGVLEREVKQLDQLLEIQYLSLQNDAGVRLAWSQQGTALRDRSPHDVSQSWARFGP